jgi:hypothetical protein
MSLKSNRDAASYLQGLKAPFPCQHIHIDAPRSVVPTETTTLIARLNETTAREGQQASRLDITLID